MPDLSLFFNPDLFGFALALSGDPPRLTTPCLMSGRVCRPACAADGGVNHKKLSGGIYAIQSACGIN
jgi:hypothetical protein